jgi:putative flippase GtrA
MTKINRHFREVICFGLVGVTATLVHYVIALLAIEAVQVNIYVGNLTGYLCALSVSYFGHGKLTFRAALCHNVFRRFACVSLLTFCASELLLAGLENSLHLSHRIAMAIVVICVPAVSFALNKFWVYQHPSERPIAEEK